MRESSQETKNLLGEIDTRGDAAFTRYISAPGNSAGEWRGKSSGQQTKAVEKTVGWKRLFSTRREDHGEYSKITGIIETPNVASLVSYGLAS